MQSSYQVNMVSIQFTSVPVFSPVYVLVHVQCKCRIASCVGGLGCVLQQKARYLVSLDKATCYRIKKVWTFQHANCTGKQHSSRCNLSSVSQYISGLPKINSTQLVNLRKKQFWKLWVIRRVWGSLQLELVCSSDHVFHSDYVYLCTYV